MRIFFSVGEPSGDLHGSNLIARLKQRDPTVQCVGFGGPKMRAAGCDVLEDLTQWAVMLVGGAIAAFLCFQYVPQQDSYAESLFLPLIVIGLVMGFGVVYGMWHRMRSEWRDILGEGIVPYLLTVAGLFVLIGAISTPFVTKPMDFVNSIPAVNLVGDGTRELKVLVPAIDPDVDPDAALLCDQGRPLSAGAKPFLPDQDTERESAEGQVGH